MHPAPKFTREAVQLTELAIVVSQCYHDLVATVCQACSTYQSHSPGTEVSPHDAHSAHLFGCGVRGYLGLPYKPIGDVQSSLDSCFSTDKATAKTKLQENTAEANNYNWRDCKTEEKVTESSRSFVRKKL